MDDTDTGRDRPRDSRVGSSGAVKSNPTDSRTAQPIAHPPSSADASVAVSEDPFDDLTPAERFARALERRDAAILKLSQGSKR